MPLSSWGIFFLKIKLLWDFSDFTLTQPKFDERVSFMKIYSTKSSVKVFGSKEQLHIIQVNFEWLFLVFSLKRFSFQKLISSRRDEIFVWNKLMNLHISFAEVSTLSFSTEDYEKKTIRRIFKPLAQEALWRKKNSFVWFSRVKLRLRIKLCCCIFEASKGLKMI